MPLPPPEPVPSDLVPGLFAPTTPPFVLSTPLGDWLGTADTLENFEGVRVELNILIPATGPEVHVVLGLPRDEYEALLDADRRAGGDGVDATKEPRWHSHPRLGITGHAHSMEQVARMPHTHRPELGWDTTRPIML